MAKIRKRKNRAANRIIIYFFAIVLIGAAAYGVLEGVTFALKTLKGDGTGQPLIQNPDSDPNQSGKDVKPPQDGKEDPKKLSGITICIDPGHGYSDPGTVAPDSLNLDIIEKTVTLGIGLTLRDLLEAEGATVIMTREDDVDDDTVWKKLSLDERCKIANDSKADFFLSLHCDSFEDDSSVDGGKLYYFDAENRDEAELKKILEAICGAVAGAGESKPGTELQKGDSAFQVVRKVTVPAALYELGFITNPTEAANMKDEQWRNKMANAIFEGLCNYFASES